MKILKIFGISFGSLLSIAFFYFAYSSPETYIYSGHQVPRKFLHEIRSLDLLEEDEKIKYFYSDAIFNIKEGMYFVPGRNITLYSEKWKKPVTIIKLENITKIDVEYDDTFWTDSFVSIETKDGLEVSFPLSSEKGRDKKFMQYLRLNTKIDQNE